ncbi:MAG: putative CRISPR-associated protein [Ignavibacteria bacterium]|jgi:putative CRISPR-associated protein (TIGR02619 family)|nr:putative CRISPR-associated protein [Ignavibacteria bacterium]MDH7528812.1 putative CRISPR-associated protein [Ignavibacteria bacterium]
MKKEFHVINVGASIITNYQKSLKENDEIKNKSLSDNEFWREILSNNKDLLNRIYEFISEKPFDRSAELNSFLKKIENSDGHIEVYFVGTKTAVSEICVKILKQYLENSKRYKFTVYAHKEVPGYFMNVVYGEDKVKEFIEGIADMLDHLIEIAEKKKKEGYKVYFNPTGGFKAHVISMALAGFFTGCEVYYIHEEFRDLITFPPLFYLPKRKEQEILEILNNKPEKYIVGKDFKDLSANYKDEFDRLSIFGLGEYEFDEENKPYRFRITSKGKIILAKLRGEID